MEGVLLETHITIEYPYHSKKMFVYHVWNTRPVGWLLFLCCSWGGRRQKGMLRKMDSLLTTPADTLLQKSKELLWEHMVFD